MASDGPIGEGENTEPNTTRTLPQETAARARGPFAGPTLRPWIKRHTLALGTKKGTATTLRTQQRSEGDPFAPLPESRSSRRGVTEGYTHNSTTHRLHNVRVHRVYLRSTPVTQGTPQRKGYNTSSYMTDLPGHYVYYEGSEREGGNRHYIALILTLTIFPITPAIRVWTRSRRSRLHRSAM